MCANAYPGKSMFNSASQQCCKRKGLQQIKTVWWWWLSVGRVSTDTPVRDPVATAMHTNVTVVILWETWFLKYE